MTDLSGNPSEFEKRLVTEIWIDEELDPQALKRWLEELNNPKRKEADNERDGMDGH